MPDPYEELRRVKQWVVPFYEGTAIGQRNAAYVQRLERAIDDRDAAMMLHYAAECRATVRIDPDDVEEFLQHHGRLPK